MKINEIICEDQLDEYGNAPNNSTDPRVAGGVPNAVGNLKARRLARQQPAQQQPADPVPQQAQPATQAQAKPAPQQAQQQPADPAPQQAQPATQAQSEPPEGFWAGVNKGFQRNTGGEYKKGQNWLQSMGNAVTAGIKGATDAVNSRNNPGAFTYKSPTDASSEKEQPAAPAPVAKTSTQYNPNLVTLTGDNGQKFTYKLMPTGWSGPDGKPVDAQMKAFLNNYQKQLKAQA